MVTTSYEIHPAIGIARLGSSPLSTEEGYFLGPEPGVTPPARYRDSAGDLKRQAARFRIFVCQRNEKAELLDASELALGDLKKITWTVHLVNRKGAGWRRFGLGHGHRNHASGDDTVDQALIIDPGPRAVASPGQHAVFDTGKFRSTPVKLGEIVMEPDGRLLVLGGHGRSGSDPPQPRLTAARGFFASNDKWFDDTADGPVTAAIERVDGTTVEARAWVVVGPPDFAPGITNFLTLYDVLLDRAIARGHLRAPTERPEPLSFVRHVQPILARALGYRWVNRHAAAGFDGNGRGHGPGGTADFSRHWHLLADPSGATQRLRGSIVSRLRNPDLRVPRPATGMLDPRLNAVEVVSNDPNNVLTLTHTQYKIMQAWANGDFVNDLDRPVDVQESLPEALDRMALEACVGGALFPGIEVNDAITNNAWFVDGEPFRLSHDIVRPGAVTQQNAVPWQADFHVCRWEEYAAGMPKRLGWWPAQRPDDVYTNVESPTMVPWARGLGEDFQEMIDKWDRLGVVVDKGTPTAPFFVEAERDTQALGP